MSLAEMSTIYEGLWRESRDKFSRNEFELDPQIDDPVDTRRGITLIARLKGEITTAINDFLAEAQALEPNQYYYPESDLHLTLLSIITCQQGFSKADVHMPDYQDLVERCLATLSPFTIEYTGVTASPSCILLQGFVQTDQLQMVREKLRQAFAKSSLIYSIDSRYPIKTAHSTVIRFRQPVENKDQLIELLESYRQVKFGTVEIDRLELVSNDWYMQDRLTERISEIALD